MKTEFKYVEAEGNWICSDEDCKMPVPNDRQGKLAIALFRDGELVHYKCAFCRGTLVERAIGSAG